MSLRYWKGHSQLSTTLQAAGLSKELSDVFAENVSVRFDQIFVYLINDSASTAKVYLKDMDWKVNVPSPLLMVQVSIASDKLSSIQQPTLLLQLTLGHNDAGEVS